MNPTRPRRIHHIDIVVRDLDRAVERFTTILGVAPGPREHLPQRGVDLARVRIGETWLILVQPVRDDSPVREFLDTHGEGFFHMALEVDDVAAVADTLAGRGVRLRNRTPRRGVEGWKLVDIELEETFGAMIQLAQPEEK